MDEALLKVCDYHRTTPADSFNRHVASLSSQSFRVDPGLDGTPSEQQREQRLSTISIIHWPLKDDDYTKFPRLLRHLHSGHLFILPSFSASPYIFFNLAQAPPGVTSTIPVFSVWLLVSNFTVLCSTSTMLDLRAPIDTDTVVAKVVELPRCLCSNRAVEPLNRGNPFVCSPYVSLYVLHLKIDITQSAQRTYGA